ncbi:MAG TPA: asparagine synthase (glutamine-hydrolyzing) [Usitatibacter sp.]|jgi:asparagine synthase (glutamine-hydrolysing)|nr:asparagine synthase (glutamine-hydrolyzing) [Usitatibacter sp.]
MCGLTGFVDPDHVREGGDARSRIEAMSAALAHRGPDASGHWVAREEGLFTVALGHRRLAIIDVSEAGAQPMTSHDGRYVIAFNGEIYNYAELRSRHEARRGAVAWRGHSDTEVLLELFGTDGVQGTLASLDGMFALALYDRREKTLTLARDAFGEKPLHYGFWNATLVFGSELRALRAWPGFAPQPDHDALAGFFAYGYIPCPRTIHRGILKLAPAMTVTFTAADLRGGILPAPRSYWDMVGTALRAQGSPFTGTQHEAADAVAEVLARSTRGRMVSDVPLGALLSGGIDSSLATALMQASSSQPVRTFSVGMDEPGFNEAEHARTVARHLGTRHTELVLTPAQVQAVIPEIAAVYDEPFADSSQVPTFIVSRMAREHVTVAVSGDGGDEIFGGYNRYFHAPRLWSRVAAVPAPMRQALGAALRSIPLATVDLAVRAVGPLAPAELTAGRAGEKVHKLGGLVGARTHREFHERLLRTGEPGDVLAIAHANPSLLEGSDPRASHMDSAARAMLVDTANYLPDDILAKVDRASMAVALEVRTPYLNRELFELAWSLPASMKMRGGQGKLVLRDVLYRHVPRHLVDRPKAGFAVPVGRWMRGALRPWAEGLLSENALRSAGMLRVETIRDRWKEHLAGRRDHTGLLWSVLMYQGWRARHAGTP